MVDASPRIAVRVGPTHGVQATANAAPATSGPPFPARSISASTRHSALSLVMNSVATKKMPIAMIRTPAILLSVSMLVRSACEIPVAESPRTMKIVEKLAMKISDGGSTVRQFASSRSRAETPVTADR